RGANPGRELQHGIGPVDMPINGIPIGEHPSGERLTYDNHWVLRLAIELVEITPGKDGNAECGEKSRRYHAQLCARIFARQVNMTVRRELQGKPTITPWNMQTECSFLDPGYPTNAAHGFFIER